MSDKTLDLKQLKIFLTVASSHSVKQTAAQFGLTPPAVSQTLASLEKQLGITLFDRNVRPMELTARGRSLLVEGTKLVAQQERVLAGLTSEKNAFQSLRLGVSEAVTLTIGPWLLKNLSAQIADLSVYSQLAPALIDKLSKNQIDVAFCSGKYPEGNDWYRKEVWKEEFLLVTSKSVGPVKTKEALKKLADTSPYIGYNPEYRDQSRADRILSSLNVSPVKRISVATSYELIGMVALENGFAIVPPTNIWCGQAFFKDVTIGELPQIEKNYRRMWVVGKALERISQIDLIDACAQELMQKFMNERLSESCPGLAQYITLNDISA